MYATGITMKTNVVTAIIITPKGLLTAISTITDPPAADDIPIPPTILRTPYFNPLKAVSYTHLRAHET